MLCCHGVRYSHRMSKICHDGIKCTKWLHNKVSFYPGISVSGFEGHLQIFQVIEWWQQISVKMVPISKNYQISVLVARPWGKVSFNPVPHPGVLVWEYFQTQKPCERLEPCPSIVKSYPRANSCVTRNTNVYFSFDRKFTKV